MATLENLVIVGVRDNPEKDLVDTEAEMARFYLNVWKSERPEEPVVLPVPYRGGLFGGFNDLITLSHYLLLADAEGIMVYDLNDLSQGYKELNGVKGVSEQLCNTSNYLISNLQNNVQIRSWNNIIASIKRSKPTDEFIEIPYREIQIDDEGSTTLSTIPVRNSDIEFTIMNNNDEKTYLIEPKSCYSRQVELRSKVEFPYTFQRREQYHVVPTGSSNYLIFTEATSDEQYPNRVYSLNIGDIPTITELEPLECENRRILSMVPSDSNGLILLSNYQGRSFLEVLDPQRRIIVKSKRLANHYAYGNRLYQADGKLLIIDYLKNKISDTQSEDFIQLLGADFDTPIPRISSIWENPQYLYINLANEFSTITA